MTNQTYTKDSIHLERVFQNHLIDQLISNQGYIKRDTKTDYDVEAALDKELVMQFIKETQSDEWARLDRRTILRRCRKRIL